MQWLWRKTVRVANRDVLQGELIATGGFAYVYSGTDAQTGEKLAVRRSLLQDEEALAAAHEEIRLLKRIPLHPHIMRFFGADILHPDQGDRGGHPEAVALFEYCPGGNLLTCLEEVLAPLCRSPPAAQTFFSICTCPCLAEPEVLEVLKCTVSALAHLHSLAITHYDIKSENLLRGQDRLWKLGDFGSASERTFHLHGASRKLLLEAEEFICGRCTPFYRAPEIADVHLRWPIGPPVDIFALGCVVFACVAGTHPFPTDSALANIQARFHIPREAEEAYAPAFLRWTRRMLAREPSHRPLADELLLEVRTFSSCGREPPDIAQDFPLRAELTPIEEQAEQDTLESIDPASIPRSLSLESSFTLLPQAIHGAKEHLNHAIDKVTVERANLQKQWDMLEARMEIVQAQQQQAQQLRLQLEEALHQQRTGQLQWGQWQQQQQQQHAPRASFAVGTPWACCFRNPPVPEYGFDGELRCEVQRAPGDHVWAWAGS